MSIIQRDYLSEPRQVEFPPELALLIVRKAQRMAERFEQTALDTMTSTARRALLRGTDPRQIAREMELGPRTALPARL